MEEAKRLLQDADAEPLQKKSRASAEAKEAKGQRLQSGVVLLRGFIDGSTQRAVAQEVVALGRGEDGFYACNNEKTVNMEMMNLGLRMDGKPHQRRIPESLLQLAEEASRAASEVDPTLPIIMPDVLVVNRYNPRSKLNLHADLPTKGNRRVPVVSVSLGCAAEFVWKGSWSKKAQLRSVTLQSGDCLVFGGKARGIVHGVRRILDGTCPEFLSGVLPREHRLNLNFRQYAWTQDRDRASSSVGEQN